MSIVVAGSSRAIRDHASRAASSSAQDVRFCETGAGAVELVMADAPLVVISEVELPDISGIQLCRVLQGDDASPLTSFVLVAPSDDSRARFLVHSAFPGASVIEPTGEAIVAAVEKAVRLARTDSRERHAEQTVLQRLSRSSDRALLEAVVAAEVRSMGEAGTRERLSGLLAVLFGQLFHPAWTALLVDQSPTEMHLASPQASRVEAERQAREAFGVGSEVPCLWQPLAGPASSDAQTLVVEAPVIIANKHCAQLAVAFPASAGVHDERRMVDLVASELGGPLHVTLLLEEMQRAATTDPLTGLLNRRAMLDQMNRERARADRYGQPTSVLLLDVDHFKSVNDVHGHAAGDGVLRGLAALLGAHARTSDLIARWGGEEFLIVLPHTPPVGALAFAERTRAAIAARPFDIGEATPLAVTVSIGLAGAYPPIELEAMVEDADRALYEAKRSGRNRVCVGTPRTGTTKENHPPVANPSRQGP
jgi:two-component system, cell cycle response regulator